MAKDKCRQDASIIRRATAALVPLGKEKVWQIRKSQLEGKKGRAPEVQVAGFGLRLTEVLKK